MAVSIFTRFGNVRNVININNINAVGGVLCVRQHSNVPPQSYASTVKEIETLFDDIHDQKPARKVSKAMRIYLQRSKEYHEFVDKEIAKYELGKRHLANMMGEDPDTFTQEDIDRAIQYLLPSGLYDWRARPIMCHPNTLFEHRKEAEFDETGRPHHFLFYTCKPNYYNILYEIAASIKDLNQAEDAKVANRGIPSAEDKFDLLGSEWLLKEDVEAQIMEEITPAQYEYFIQSFIRLAEHPMSKHKSDFIMRYRKKLKGMVQDLDLPPLEFDNDGRPFVVVKQCMRKSARGEVKVIAKGSGNITINGQDITYFRDLQSRQHIIFPLIFTDMTDKVDIEATVTGGGPTGQSGAIRWGIAQGIRNFVDIEMIEKMRIAGLLTRDWRRRERKKWGQEGARRKFTWKKR